MAQVAPQPTFAPMASNASVGGELTLRPFARTVRIAPNPDTGAPPEADIAQHAFPTMGERPGGSPVQEHPRVLQKDPRVL
jgi:hypothetical protein